MASNATNQTSKANFKILKEKSRLTINITDCFDIIAANEKYLLCYAKNRFLLIDEQGNEMLSVQSKLSIYDMCWSSYLNQFLILSDESKFYALDIDARQLQQVRKFGEHMRTCTCYEKTFLIARTGNGSTTEKYNLPNWHLERTFEEEDRYDRISRIRFSRDDTHIGLMKAEKGRISGLNYAVLSI